MNPKDSVGAKKAALRFVPAALALEVAPVMQNGAAKYGPFNWREQPVSAVTYVEAALRHLYAWLEGQDVAEDSQLDHIAHAAASMGILLDAKANGSLLDDRVAGPAADILRRLDKSLPAGLTPVYGDDLPEPEVQTTVYGIDNGVPGSDVTFRGEWPPDTRVGGYLTCCGATEHTMECPQYR